MTEQELIVEFTRKFTTEQEARQRAGELGPQWSILKLRPRKYWQLARAAGYAL